MQATCFKIISSLILGELRCSRSPLNPYQQLSVLQYVNAAVNRDMLSAHMKLRSEFPHLFLSYLDRIFVPNVSTETLNSAG
jgi:hypothetical protein